MAAVTTRSVRVLNTAARRENGITSWTAATITTTSALKIRRPATTPSTTTRINTRRLPICPTSWTTRAASASWAARLTAIFKFPTRRGCRSAPRPTAAPVEFRTAGCRRISIQSDLNENQNEQNYYGVVTYQKSAGDLNFQVSAFGRNSDVHFTPDPVGDLYFNGVASDVQTQALFRRTAGRRQLRTQRQAHDSRRLDGCWTNRLPPTRPRRCFPWTADRAIPTGTPFPIVDNNALHGHVCRRVFAGRMENPSQGHAQLRRALRRVQFVVRQRKPAQSARQPDLSADGLDDVARRLFALFHAAAGGKRVRQRHVRLFDGTSNVVPDNAPDSPVKAERANYFDAGHHAKNHASICKSAWTAITKRPEPTRRRIVRADADSLGVQLCARARSMAWNSPAPTPTADFPLTPTSPGRRRRAKTGTRRNSCWRLRDDVAYVQNHWIYLDHDQTRDRLVRRGLHLERRSRRYSTRVYVDAIYGSGLRQDGGGIRARHNDPIPNGATVPAYYSINCRRGTKFQIRQETKLLKARLDVVNVTDKSMNCATAPASASTPRPMANASGFFGSLSFVF